MKVGIIQLKSSRPGVWISTCFQFGAYHMMPGTKQAIWQVYERLDGNDPINGELIGNGLTLTLKEALRDAFPEAKLTPSKKT